MSENEHKAKFYVDGVCIGEVSELSVSDRELGDEDVVHILTPEKLAAMFGRVRFEFDTHLAPFRVVVDGEDVTDDVVKVETTIKYSRGRDPKDL